LFTFAVIADSHVNPVDGESPSPWLTNRLANERTRHVVDQLNAAAPAFVVHLGDIVHPLPASHGFAGAAHRFQELFADLGPPLHLVPGNHDVGDKPLAWMPAATVREDYVEQYRRHFGPDHYSFDRGDCHFVVINCQLFNSGFALEAGQRTWLEDDLATHGDRRLFLFTHYPPYIALPDETSHYDNIDEPCRSWLLDLACRHGVEAMFAGHVHNFFYNRHRGTDIYVLPSVSFVRHDYAEMQRSAPSREQGRDDLPKLGFMRFTVYEQGHLPEVIRTYGRTGKTASSSAAANAGGPAAHVRVPGGQGLGVDLRHAWCETTAIPYSGAVDEFSRKLARNDYPLMALWEMGLKRLRVPISDLATPATRSRMEDLAGNGHGFTIFGFGLPQPWMIDLVRDHAELVRCWEVVLDIDADDGFVDSVARLQDEVARPIFLSRLRTSADGAGADGRFSHFIEHGFTVAEIDRVAKICASARSWMQAGGGVVFRVTRDRDPRQDVATIAALCDAEDVAAGAHVRLARDDPASSENDETGTAVRVCHALCASWLHPRVDVTLDTFASHDRGYFPRTGLIDRACNPTLAGQVLGRLNAALPRVPLDEPRLSRIARDEVVEACWMTSDDWTAALVTAVAAGAVRAIPGYLDGLSHHGEGLWIDLATGVETPAPWSRKRGGNPQTDLLSTVACAGPSLFFP
jgi:hypothetical protein